MEENIVLKKLRERFPNSILEIKSFRDELTIYISKKDIYEICKYLYSEPELKFIFLTDLCGVDLYPEDPRFEVVYFLCSFERKERIRLKIRVSESESVLSVESIWKAANWLEREVYDLFGIRFDNHPDLRRILLWEDFEGHPLRKDYPVEGPDFDKPFVPEV